MQTTMLKVIGFLILSVLLLLAGIPLYLAYLVNPKVIQELESEPNSVRAQQVMLLTFRNGRRIPVNYLREGSLVYVGADGRWWRTLRGAGEDVELLIQGVRLTGRAIAITDDPRHRDEVFRRLRPTTPKWLPEWMKGVLIEITLSATK